MNIPHQNRVTDFLNSEKNKKKDYQGYLELLSSRKSKRKVLDMFAFEFRNVNGLTLSTADDMLALKRYDRKLWCRRGPDWQKQWGLLVMF